MPVQPISTGRGRPTIRAAWRATLLIVLLAGLAAPAARADTDNASWNRDLERMDFYTNLPEGGDNRFYTVVNNTSSNTNVDLLFPNTLSMRGLTQKLYRIRHDLGGASPAGCGNAYLNNLTYFMPTTVTPPAGAAAYQGKYSSTITYPDPEPTYAGGGGQSSGISSTGYYRFRAWPAGTTSGNSESAANACSGAANGNGVMAASCYLCVTSKGYWLNPLVADNDITTSAGVFAGNWLRFYPPKWLMLRLAYKRLVNGPLLSVLREGVGAENGSFGGILEQKMLPQSCSGTGRPLNQKQGAVDNLGFDGTANPLAEMLFNSAWYMGGQESTWYFDQNNQSTKFSGNKSGPCNACSGDFLVLFSDGRGDAANPNCTPVDGVTPPQCSEAAQCSTVGMGSEGDGDDFFDATTDLSAGKTGHDINGDGVRQTPAGTCDMDFADDVARWTHNHDVSYSNTGSKLSTFVVAIGDPNNTYGEMTSLKEVASAGGGEFVVASDFATLEKNIEHVFVTIISRSTSFSTSSVTTVQTRGITSAYLPRFRPLSGADWFGTLLRFQLLNEFSAGCTATDYGKIDALNPNGDSSCSDYYLTDANNKFVGEDSDGNFVLLDNTKPWSNGWPPKADAAGDGPQVAGSNPATFEYLAKPVWDAATNLTNRENGLVAGTRTDERAIYTVVPNGTGYGPSLTLIDPAQASTLTAQLALGGVTGDTCKLISSLTRTTYATENDCAADLLRFIEGRDVFRQNPYNRTIPQPSPLQARPNVLGDIFHSSPIVVSPPVPQFLCDLGIVNQCTSSLYAGTLTPGGGDAYDAYFKAKEYRPQIVLVGANDGMLHAFNAANDQVDDKGVHTWDLGTGEELWAFIPPDLLPKLQRYAVGERHELLVDGSPLVRDIWVDGSGATRKDGVKQADEFHTVAIVPEREGGRHYFALDVTDPTTPKFLWEWPKPGTTLDLDMGETWNDYTPASPAIGPIAVADTDGPLTVNGTKADERYAVAFGGGWDPLLLRGRSINVVDAWTGQTLDRFARADATSGSDPRAALASVAAPVSFLDTDGDGLFDALTVGDAIGQVWVLNMQNPGADADGDGLFDNWFGGRAFVEFKGSPLWHRSPFFQRPAAAVLPSGDVRVYLGSGSRDQIKDPKGGSCGLPNIPACIRKNCSVDMQSKSYRIGPGAQGSSSGHYVTDHWVYGASGTTVSSDSFSTDGSASASNTASDATDVDLETSINCGGNSVTYSSLEYCDWGASVPGVDCPVSSGRTPDALLEVGTPPAPYQPSFTMENTRFYSIKLFDTSGATNRRRFTTLAGAQAYDAAALTDSDLVNAASATATQTSNGWYLAHTYSTDEKTATGGLLLDGCMLWDTLVPNPNQTVACGATTLPADTSYLYQADAVTGAIQCGEAGSATQNTTLRATSQATYVTPQAMAAVVSVNSATGQEEIGGLRIPTGQNPPQGTSMGTGAPLGIIHWLEVPRRLHECRHGDPSKCN